MADLTGMPFVPMLQDLDALLSSSLFTPAELSDGAGAGGQVGQHPPRKWIECPGCRTRFEQRVDSGAVDLGGGEHGDE